MHTFKYSIIDNAIIDLSHIFYSKEHISFYTSNFFKVYSCVAIVILLFCFQIIHIYLQEKFKEKINPDDRDNF